MGARCFGTAWWFQPQESNVQTLEYCRRNHHPVPKLGVPITEWRGATTKQIGDLNGTPLHKPKMSHVSVLVVNPLPPSPHHHYPSADYCNPIRKTAAYINHVSLCKLHNDVWGCRELFFLASCSSLPHRPKYSHRHSVIQQAQSEVMSLTHTQNNKWNHTFLYFNFYVSYTGGGKTDVSYQTGNQASSFYYVTHTVHVITINISSNICTPSHTIYDIYRLHVSAQRCHP
jgi:hypothetical protein